MHDTYSAIIYEAKSRNGAKPTYPFFTPSTGNGNLLFLFPSQLSHMLDVLKVCV